MLRYITLMILPIAGLAAIVFWPDGTAADEDFTSREKAIISKAQQRDWPVVVFGDSITELAALPSICSKPTLNAGVSGQKASGLERVAIEVLRHTEPELVIFALGTNDSWAERSTERNLYIATMRRLIDFARQDGARVVLVKPGEVAPFGKGYVFDNSRIRTIGSDLDTLGTATVGPMPSLTSESSDDGVHPNAVGYRQWTSVVSRACVL